MNSHGQSRTNAISTSPSPLFVPGERKSWVFKILSTVSWLSKEALTELYFVPQTLSPSGWQMLSLLYHHLTLNVLNFWTLTSYCSLKPLWSSMGKVVPARTSPTLHPPSPPTVHQLSRLTLYELIGSLGKNYKMYGWTDSWLPSGLLT